MKDDKLKMMKQDYEKLEIPQELKGKVEEAMKQAKQENERERFIKKIPKTIGYGAVAAMLAITVLANSGQQIAYAMAEVPVLGAISKVVTFRTYEDKNGTMEAKINTPKVDGDSDAVDELNKQMEEYTEKIKKSFESDLQVVLKADGNAENGHQEVNTDYQIVCDNDRILSIQLNTTVVMAGSNIYSKCYTLDKKTGRILELKDLFTEGADYQKVLSEEIIRQMKQQMKEDDTKSYFLDTEDVGDDFDFTEIKVDQNFFIDKDRNLNISFDKYEVAPGYMGACSFKISKDVVTQILAENSILK